MKIEQAAILYKGKIYKGKRHCDIIHYLALNKKEPTPIRGTQGFVDQEGNFYDRLQAADLAIKSGQIDKLKWPPYLYSEDLY